MTHSFGSGPSAVCVSIKESDAVSADFGLHVWPSEFVLAHHLWSIRDEISADPSRPPRRVLELGCGVPVAGILAAKLGAVVTLTDRCDKSSVLALAQENCALNDVSASSEVLGLDWGILDGGGVTALLGRDVFDYIIGADVFYDTALFEAVFATVRYFMEKSPSLVFLTAYHQRSCSHTVGPLLSKWGMSASRVGVGTEFASHFPAGTTVLDSICVFRISLSPAAVAPVPLPLQYARDGFVILKQALTSDQLTAARAECDRLCAKIGSDRLVSYLVDRMCVLDMLETISTREDSPARRDSEAYRALRCGASGAVDALNPMSTLVLHTLPTLVREVTGWIAPLFFNEHYIMKPCRTVSEFRWHRDSDLQLAACFEKANYTSVWCAIDDVSAENGTLTLIPLSDAAGGALVAADPDVTDPAFDPPSAVTMSLQAGDAVMFDSSVWHRSGPNQSLAFRRALYCQYSEHVITSKGAIPLPSFDPRRQGPLSFAVPCNL